MGTNRGIGVEILKMFTITLAKWFHFERFANHRIEEVAKPAQNRVVNSVRLIGIPFILAVSKVEID